MRTQDISHRFFLVLLYIVITFPLIFRSGNAITHPVHKASGSPTFKTGERLEFNLYWGFVKVGKAVMEELPQTNVEGRAARHFRLKMRTNALIDLIYKVRSEIEAYTDPVISRSLLYNKKQYEHGIEKSVRVKFDWANHKAGYMNFARHGQEIEILPGTLDPFGILYYLRSIDFARTESVEIPVTDGKKCILSPVSRLGIEQLQFAGKTYQAYVLHSDLQGLEGLFEKSQDSRFTLWLSTDPSRIPLLIKIDLFFGTVKCKLVSAIPG